MRGWPAARTVTGSAGTWAGIIQPRRVAPDAESAFAADRQLPAGLRRLSQQLVDLLRDVLAEGGAVPAMDVTHDALLVHDDQRRKRLHAVLHRDLLGFDRRVLQPQLVDHEARVRFLLIR